MNFFISDALAEGAGQGETTMAGFIPIILIFVLFYFLLIRPQAKKAKEHKGMVASLSKGDEVVTNGGILGRLTEVDDSFLTMEIADGVAVKVQRHSIATLVPKGTYK